MAKTNEQLEREIKELRLMFKKHVEQMLKVGKEQGRLLKQLTKQVDVLLKE